MDASSFLSDSFLGQPAWIWLIFVGVVVALLALDLGLFHKSARKPKAAESLLGTLFYVGVAGLFGLFLWQQMGAQKALEYFTGYVIEQSLSLDNIFVISLIFSALSIPSQHQHRVLFWGVISVLVLRGLMIGIGSALIAHFTWVLALFGVFLVITGIRMLFGAGHDEDMGNNRILQWLRKHMRITKEMHGKKFFITAPVRGKPVLWATPLMVALIMVEIADIVFAVDSIPAVFAVTRDPYIVYTSNIFAILGLRTLYFALEAMVTRFHLLSKALAVVLMFIGGKICYAHFTGNDIPIEYSLGAVLAILLAGVGLSLVIEEKKA
ncbi:MAG TPA: TerC family protein [Alphaproteobacteria bacterium]|nr:TerC family protein [Alphaproteobacteria bacterium]